MAKYANPLALDAALAVVAGATHLVVVSGAPATLADVNATRLGEAALAAGDFAVGDDGSGGRRLLVAGKSGLVVLANGTADHVALIDAAAGRLLHVTSCPAQPLLAGASFSVAGWAFSIGAPQ